MAAAKPAYPVSESGYWTVKISRTFEHEGFYYKPSQEITVNEDTLKDFLAAEIIVSVNAAA